MPQIKVDDLTITGVSVACHGSLVTLPQFKVAFDCGCVSDEYVNDLLRCSCVCITHGHADHIGSLHMDAFLRDRKKAKKVTYLMPKCCVDNFQNAHHYFSKLNVDDEKISDKKNFITVGVTGGDIHVASKNLHITPVETIHRVPSVGYALTQTKTKLMEKHIGKSHEELMYIRKQGEPISDVITFYPFSYTGDTTIEGVLRSYEFMTSKVLMTECTILDSEVSQSITKSRGHIHLKDIIDNQHLFKNHVVLCHFSPRYSADYIRKCVDDAPFTEDFRKRLHLFL